MNLLKTSFHKLWAIAATALLTVSMTTLSAQHVVPEVYFHDFSQRLFVVEAARIQAWIANRGGSNVDTIQFTASGQLNGNTSWQVKWLDAEGQEIKNFDIDYDLVQLNSGPEFFRSIWQQLKSGEDNQAPAPAADVSELADSTAAYWQGARDAGTSRMSAVKVIANLTEAAKPDTDPRQAARLSGLMTHTALPTLAGSITLDYVMLARASAWLCHAEDLLRTPLDQEFAPILFLGGREKSAVTLWRRSASETPPVHGLARCWDALLGGPASSPPLPAPLEKVAMLLVDEESRQHALPFLAYFLGQDSSHTPTVTELMIRYCGLQLARSSDYGPLLAHEGSFGTIRGYAALSPVRERLTWLQTLAFISGLSAEPEDVKISKKAGAAATFISAAGSSSEPSLIGIAEASELITAGYQPKGELHPVSGITIGDLLVYGWDSTAAQMEGWHNYLNRRWGVSDEAKAMREQALEAVPSLGGLLLPYNSEDREPPAPIEVMRLEYFDSLYLARWTLPSYNQTLRETNRKGSKVPAANLFKRGEIAFPQTHLVCKYGGKELPFKEYLKPIVQRAGEPANRQALGVVTWGIDKTFRERFHKEYTAILRELQDNTPNSISTRMRIAHLDCRPGENALQIAKTVEKLYWQAPGSAYISMIFDHYVMAGEIAAAKRFYEQCQPIAADTMTFSNDMAPKRWSLAFVEGDAADMAEAVEIGSSYSFADLTKQICNAIAIGKDKDAAELIDACLDRYVTTEARRKDHSMTRLKNFLPLLPALKDPTHPERAAALDHFKKDTYWPTVQMALIRRYELPIDDAVRFLGGDESNPERLTIIAYLRKDPVAFEEAYKTTMNSTKLRAGNMGSTMLHALRSELLGLKPTNLPSLRPESFELLLDKIARLTGGKKADAGTEPESAPEPERQSEDE